MPNSQQILGLDSSIFDAYDVPILIRDGVDLVYCNQAAVDMWDATSREELLGLHPGDLAPSRQPDGRNSREQVELYLRAAREQGSAAFRWRHRSRSGREFEGDVQMDAFEWQGRALVQIIHNPVMADDSPSQTGTDLSRGWLRSFFNSTTDAIVIIDRDNTVIDANRGFEQMFGHKQAALIGRNLDDCIIPPYRHMESTRLLGAVLTGSNGDIDSTVRLHRDGHPVRVSVKTSPVILHDRRLGVCVIYRDISAQYEAAESIRRGEARLRAVIGTAPILLFVIDAEGRFEFADGRARHALGVDSCVLPGRMIADVFADDPEQLATVRQAMAGTPQTTHRETDVGVFELRYVCERDAQGRPNGVIGVAHDMTEVQSARQSLAHMASHDELTGLPNRTLFRDRVEAAIQRARRHGCRVATLFADLDHFKTINDSLGHAAGDHVLQTAAARLTSVLRETDTVARMGGDEFAILLEDLQSPEAVAGIARKLVRAMDRPVVKDDMHLKISASVGVSIHPEDGETVDALLQSADMAMYEAKKSRNNFRFFSEGMRDEALALLAFGDRMPKALDNGEFVLHYQPGYRLTDHGIAGVEALLRWNHPDKGMLQPNDFLPLAEKTGLIGQLGDWVIAAACRQLAAWQAGGIPVERMSINISAKQFRDRNFVRRVADIIAETGVQAGQLLFEVSENRVFPYPEEVREILRECRAMGIGVAVDDFGTGFSSLAYLRDLPVNYLKIDRSFIHGIPHERKACAITRTVIAMARSLGIRVIAEGVENADQLGFLSRRRCDEAQGCLMGCAMPRADVEALLVDTVGRQ